MFSDEQNIKRGILESRIYQRSGKCLTVSKQDVFGKEALEFVGNYCTRENIRKHKLEREVFLRKPARPYIRQGYDALSEGVKDITTVATLASFTGITAKEASAFSLLI